MHTSKRLQLSPASPDEPPYAELAGKRQQRYVSPRTLKTDPQGGPAKEEFCGKVCELPFFQGRDSDFIKQLCAYLEAEMFVAGDDIMKDGEDGDKMYVLQHGKVDVLVNKGQVTVATLDSGAVFGEMALFGSPRRSATIRAKEFCRCWFIRHGVFHHLLRKFPAEQKYFAAVARERKAKLQEVKEAAHHPEELYYSRWQQVRGALWMGRVRSNRCMAQRNPRRLSTESTVLSERRRGSSLEADRSVRRLATEQPRRHSHQAAITPEFDRVSDNVLRLLSYPEQERNSVDFCRLQSPEPESPSTEASMRLPELVTKRNRKTGFSSNASSGVDTESSTRCGGDTPEPVSPTTSSSTKAEVPSFLAARRQNLVSK